MISIFKYSSNIISVINAIPKKHRYISLASNKYNRFVPYESGISPPVETSITVNVESICTIITSFFFEIIVSSLIPEY